jgi:hypothetical protein
MPSKDLELINLRICATLTIVEAAMMPMPRPLEMGSDGELNVVGGGELDVQKEGFVACLAEDGHAEAVDGTGEVVGDGLEGAAEGVHVGVCERLCCGGKLLSR